MKIQLLYLEHGKDLDIPFYATPGSAGFDLIAAIIETETLEPMARTLVPTGFCMALPNGFEAQVRPRSGLAIKHGITIINAPGTVDADYRGEIKVPIINLGDQPFQIERGMRIAQMIIAPVIQAQFELADSLDETLRGQGGFGSTGL